MCNIFAIYGTFTDEGHRRETSEHLLRFWHFHFIHHFFYCLLDIFLDVLVPGEAYCMSWNEKESQSKLKPNLKINFAICS